MEKSSISCSTQVHSVAISRNSELMATANWKGELIVSHCDLKEPRRHIFQEFVPGKEMKGLYACAFSQIHPSIVGCTSVDKNVYLWNYETKQCEVFGEGDSRPNATRADGHKDEVNGIDFHQLRPLMCTVSDDLTGRVWDYQQGKLVTKLEGHTEAVYSASFFGSDPGLQYSVATCGFDRKINIFDLRTGRVTAVLGGHIGHIDDIIGLDYSSRHHMLASGSDDGSSILWDVRTLKLLSCMQLPQNEVKRVKFSRCGQMLAVACAEKSLGVVVFGDLNQAEPRKLAVLEGHENAVFGVAWGETSDGFAILASGCHDGKARFWQEIDPSRR